MGRVAWGSPHDALLAVAQQLCAEEIPLSEVFLEMVEASSALAADERLTPAVSELLAEPMTAAESVGTLLLAMTAAQARDAKVDDESVLRVMALAAMMVARFETYLAERVAFPTS